MLVISRRPHEKIVIPAINASIHVAAVQPGVVRVAINAPSEVLILRGELADRAAEWSAPAPPPTGTRRPSTPTKPRRADRRVREQLREFSMSVGLARLQLRAGLTGDADAALGQLHQEIQSLRRGLAGKTGAARARRTARLGCRSRARTRSAVAMPQAATQA
jgi:carbon storage regulator CsrA